MKESIANASITSMIIVFMFTIMILTLSSINYSKAFKARNKIIDIIEKYDSGYISANRGAINKKIEEALHQIGYKVNYMRDRCPGYKTSVNQSQAVSALNGTNNYLYCIYEIPNGRGEVYHVITYMFYDIPVAGTLKIKVEGDTIPFYHTIDTTDLRPDGP